jgi:glycosyltransferase involved in cell wall biosynthesis
MKPKLLCILHRSPPAHGAAKVGDIIASSQNLQDNFECRFISIKSSETIGDIGKISVKKIYLVIELYFKVMLALLFFRPQKIYFTASVASVAFYRDLIVSTLWKLYKKFKCVDIYYHYHTKGVNTFVESCNRNLKLTSFFVKDINLILLSPLLKNDFEKVNTYKQIFYLPNGVENNIKNDELNIHSSSKYNPGVTIEVLYLAHMLKEKGYLDVLNLVKKFKEENIQFHFAGSWKDKISEEEFFDFVKNNRLESKVVHHGFVFGDKKAILFKQAHILLYPTKNDAFPLTLLESLSFGVPVIATAEGSIPYILDERSGSVIGDVDMLESALRNAKINLLNKTTAMYCRKRFLDNFSLEQFERNLIEVLNQL